MRINYGDSFEDIAVKRLNISRKDVIRAVTNPIKKQRISFDGLEIYLFLQKEKNIDSFIIVVGHKGTKPEVNGKAIETLEIGGKCFRIPYSLMEKAGTNEPVALLQQLAMNFGIPMRVCGLTGKFFFREKTPVPKGFGIQEVFAQFPRQGFNYSVIYLRLTSDGYAEFAMTFGINVDEYLVWLKDEKEIQLSKKTYDVFISYKRRTAEDLARHLKEALTDEGYRAFLDVTDIPREFEGTTKWFDFRDDAIANSRRFLLLMTIGVESSEEISKELFLARKYPKMKYMYLRHQDLGPDISISNGEEIIELAEGNQVAFGTKEDLARNVLAILEQSYLEGV